MKHDTPTSKTSSENLSTETINYRLDSSQEKHDNIIDTKESLNSSYHGSK